MTIADRLKPYQVSHELVHRLKPYEVTDLPLMFRNATWATLVYWQQLLDSVEVEEPVKV